MRTAPPTFDEASLLSRIGDLSSVGSLGIFGAHSILLGMLEALLEPSVGGIRADGIVAEARRMLELNYTDPSLSVDSVVNALFVSRSYFARIFRERLGISASQYLISLRLRRAAELLLHSDHSAKEIAYLVGYSDVIHFLKEFKKRYGVGTRTYRESGRAASFTE